MSLFFFLIGIFLLYNVEFVYAFQQHKSAISIHLLTSLLSLPATPQSHPSSSSQSPEPRSMCYIQWLHTRCLCYRWQCIYPTSILSLFLSASLLHSLASCESSKIPSMLLPHDFSPLCSSYLQQVYLGFLPNFSQNCVQVSPLLPMSSLTTSQKTATSSPSDQYALPHYFVALFSLAVITS